MSEKLNLLRKPFEKHQISKLPKPTKDQIDKLKEDYKLGIRCKLCGGWHHKDVVHLDYVGHAALTDRLLDVDINWTWEPLAFDEQGLPKFDKTGGLWIKLTICGQTRLGYGNAEYSERKEIGSREKEVIGDALRNAAMRFGAALDLWHKGDLHQSTEEEKEIIEPRKPFSNIIPPIEKPQNIPQSAWDANQPKLTKNIPNSAPINAQMYQNIIDLCKQKSIPFKAVSTIIKNDFNKEDAKKLTISEYEILMKKLEDQP